MISRPLTPLCIPISVHGSSIIKSALTVSVRHPIGHMQFLFVRPRLCRGLPSDSASRWTPLSSANSSYCQACSGLSPPSNSASERSKKRRPLRVVGVFFFISPKEAVPSSFFKHRIYPSKISDMSMTQKPTSRA